MKKNKAGIIIDISQSKFYLDGHSIVNGFIDSNGVYIYSRAFNKNRFGICIYVIYNNEKE